MGAAHTLRSLAEKARRKHLPERHELVAVALEIGAEAMECTKVFETEKGPQEYAAPQHTAANKSVEIAAHLALKETPKPEQSEDALREQLEAMGYVLMKKTDTVQVSRVVEGVREPQH